MVGLPIPREVTEALKGTQQMQKDITEIRDLLKQLVSLTSANLHEEPVK